MNSRSTFAEIMDLIGRGEIASAETAARQAAEASPDDVNLTGLLGAILIKMKRYPEAEHWLRRTIELAPTFAKPHEDLGQLLLMSGRADEAIEVLKTATRLDPTLEKAFLNLGRAFAATGRGKEADEAFEKSFSLAPERGAIARATELARDGNLDEAESMCRDVLQRQPNNVDALRLMGRIASRQGRTGEAERLLRKVVEIAPGFTGAIVDLGKLLQESDQLEEAIEFFRKAIENEPDNARHHDRLGYALAPAARTAEAVEAHRRATELDPGLAGAWLGLGHTLKTIGQQEEAIAAYHKCLELRPDHGVVHWSLANLKTYRFSEDELEDMKTRVAREDVTGESEINMLFALAKAYEDRGAFDLAWDYYEQGNAKRRMQESWDPVEFEVEISRNMDVFAKDFLAAKTGLGHTDPAPIFIVGLPRSGSTLLEQILASHSQVEGTSELPYVFRVARSLNRNRANGVNYPEAVQELEAPHLERLGRQYLEHCAIHRVEGTPIFVDKNPNNFQNIGFIHMILPEAKIIDARRHPMDACFSCYRQLFAKGQTFTYDLMDVAEYYVQYQRMMDHWHDVLPGRVLTVQYEEVVADLDRQVRQILEYCQLPFEEACLRYYETDRAVRTASSEQVRQPIYTESLHRWRQYESRLDELKMVLEPLLPRYHDYE